MFVLLDNYIYVTHLYGRSIILLNSHGSCRCCLQSPPSLSSYVCMSQDIFFFNKAPLPIALPKFLMNLRAKISLQSGDCQDKICLK